MWWMGNVIETVRSTGSNYWAAYIVGEKIKTDGLKQHTQIDQKLSQHEILYPIDLKSARIEILHIGTHYIGRFFKNWFLLIQKQPYSNYIQTIFTK